MSTSPTISFIGAGNMASAIIGGMLDSGFKAANIWVSAPDDNHLQSIRKQFGVSVTTDNRYCAEQADMVVLAVKPQVMASVCSDIAPVVQNTRPLMVSIAAGLEASTLDEWLGGGLPLVRVMPNTPALVGEGACGYAIGQAATAEDGELVKRLLSAVGVAYEVKERLIDAVTGLSGSGPAYGYMIIEALSDGGVAAGLPRDISTRLAAQTMLGAAKMVLETGKHPGELKDMVCSPGGTTIEGVHELEEGGVRSALINAVRAATERAVELGLE